MSTDFVLTQSLNAKTVYKIKIKEAGSGSFERLLDTKKVPSLSVPGVFTMSPRFLFSMGLTYDSTVAVDVQAGGVITSSNSQARFNVKARSISDVQGWEPTAEVTYPTFTTPGRVALMPYVKTDVQVSVNIFGQNLENAAVVTNQYSMAFDAQVLSASEQVSKRDNVTELLSIDAQLQPQDLATRGIRGFGLNLPNIDMIKKIIESIRNKQEQTGSASQKPVACDAGSMKLNTILRTKIGAVVGGDKKDLFNKDYRFGAKCIPFAKPPGSTTTTSASPSSTSVSSTTKAPTSTPTPSTPAANQGPVAAPPTCGNEGLQWTAVSQPANNQAVGFPDFDLNAMKSSTETLAQGTTTSFGISMISVGWKFLRVRKASVYGSVLNLEHFAVNHKGYIYARVTGQYTFTIDKPDDLLLLWVGKQDYTRDNADISNSYFDDRTMTVTRLLQAGQYYPIRMVFAQGDGEVGLSGTITDPEGQVLLSKDTGASPWVVQYSCDRTTAP